MHLANFLKSPALGVALGLALGIWWGGIYISNYLERPHWTYLLVAAAYVAFGIAMAIAAYVVAPAHAQRFTPRQRLIARVFPLVPLIVAMIGVELRWA